MLKKVLLIALTAIAMWAMEPLVSVEWLRAHLHDRDLVIVDASDEKFYEREGHIPGAVQSDIGKWRQMHGRYALVRDAEAIQKEMRRLGISKSTKVIVYSHHRNGKDMLKPSYIIWAMQRYGFKNSALLDGGLPAWRKAVGVLQKSRAIYKPGNFTAAPDETVVADLSFVKRHLHKMRMLDARPPIFYFGAKKQPVLDRTGHIPGATSYLWRYSFNDDGTIKPIATLRSMLIGGLKLDPNQELVTYCTGGLETSMNWFVLHRMLGFSKARLYDASMKEWANRKDTPMVRYRWQ